MSKKNWKIFLYDILEAISKIEEYTENLDYEEFLKDSKTQDAVVRNLEIIGEAANKIPQTIRENYPYIPWKQIIGLRNRLIHGYFVIDYSIIWHIISKEIDDVKTKIKRMLEEN